METPESVLVVFDGSPLASDALDFALTVFEESEITVLDLIVPLDSSMSEGGVLGVDEELERAERETAERIVEAAEERTDAHDVTVTTTDANQPVDAILEHVADGDVDHVVMGSHARDDLSRILLSSVAASVTERAPVPVTVVR